MLGIHEEGEELPGLNPKVAWNNGRYEVETPWKLDHGILGDNYVLALKRLDRNLEKHRTENPDLLRKYSGIFKELLEGKLLEIVTEDMKPAVGNVYYMPHQLVIREDKETSKIRPVYDCSSKMKSVESLNDCLEVPEPLYADLFAVFIQFRVHEMPRCYISEIVSCHDVALVGFCDASEKGYAAVIYLRGKFENDDRKEVRTNFVSSKKRVAPKEKQTVPRLELLGALVLAMLMKKVKGILESTAPIHDVMCSPIQL